MSRKTDENKLVCELRWSCQIEQTDTIKFGPSLTLVLLPRWS